MKDLRRSASAGWRLLRGAAKSVGDRVPWRSRRKAIESADVVSVDVFGTLLLKAPGLDRDVSDAVGQKILASRENLNLPGLNESGVRAGLNRAHAALAEQALARGNDPEIPRRALYRAFFQSIAASPIPDAVIEDLVRHELERHYELTALNPEIRELLRFSRSARKRVIAISDTYLGADGLAALLRMHGCEDFDTIYASCDFGYSKFHGGLFGQMLAAERVSPDRVLHIGDDLAADVYSARSSGIRSLHYRPDRKSLPWNEARFRFGYQSLGPVFAAFCHLLLLEAERRKISRLAFVARDGEFLRDATFRLISSAPFLPQPKLDYVYLSRRATALPARQLLDRSALQEVQRVRAEGPIEELFLEFFDLDRTAVPLVSGGGAGAIERLLEDPAFQAFVKEQRDRQAVLLADYLREEGLFRGGDVALVDVGWRASTQRALTEAFGSDPEFVAPRFYYLALWSEFGPAPDPGGPAVGLLSDQRRGRSIHESAAWHLAFLLEAVCRASHGTITGFTRGRAGKVEPRLAGDTAGRRAEAAGEPGREPIRNGILAYLDQYGRALTSAPVDEARLRWEAQRRMLRLAFFPRGWEIEAVSRMVHTEGHAQDWSLPLVSAQRVHPLRSPRRWMAGLSSAWRGGYITATGGYPLSLAFFCLEALLTSAPSRVRRRLRDWALKKSDSGFDTQPREASRVRPHAGSKDALGPRL